MQVWVGDEKVGAIGVKISRGVATHGIALNVNTHLGFYEHIVPCGHKVKRVTTLRALLGEALQMGAVREQLIEHLAASFGHTDVTRLHQAELMEELRERHTAQ